MNHTDPLSEKALRDQLAAEYLEKALAQARYWASSRPDLREDFEEAALVALTRSLQGDFREESSFSTYLYRAVHNQMLMVLRSRKRRPEISVDEQDLRAIYDSRHSAPPPEHDEQKGLSPDRRMWDLLTRIAPEEDREILWLRFVLQLDLEEITRLLGISQNAAKARLHRARELAQHCARLLMPELTSWQTRNEEELL